MSACGKRQNSRSATSPHRLVRLSVLLAALFFCNTLAAVAQTNPSPGHGEYEIKAAYIYNFSKFITWPAAMLARQAPLRICVLGQDPFDGALIPIMERTAQEHSLQLAYPAAPQVENPCHVLFISASEEPRLGAILAEVQKDGTLTVGDSPGFARQGGIIGFVVRDDKVRLEINLTAARRANLKISAKLLELATIVD